MLSKILNDIALGKCFSEQALYDAKNHTIATKNDVQCINRFLYGTNTKNDSIRLQEIALYINE